MHPALPIILMGALVAIVGEDKPPQAPSERVALLANRDGTTGSVIVATRRGEVALEQAYAAAEIFADGALQRAQEADASVRSRYGSALDAQPPPPVAFTVYFVFDTDELTAASRAQFDRIKAELAARPAPEIVVTGHTDRVGSLAYNDELSLKRAQAVRSALIAAGIDAAQIEVAGRGEREPAVATADEVDEERNRRVEITVR
jgi:outer membrane protein OmpA-like peptidoglycan-associated protein